MPRSTNTRAIHVDFRYVLWVMKYVDQAENLLDELGIEYTIKNNDGYKIAQRPLGKTASCGLYFLKLSSVTL